MINNVKACRARVVAILMFAFVRRTLFLKSRVQIISKGCSFCGLVLRPIGSC